MTIIKQLQGNEKFRKILRKHKIGWRSFVKYSAFGFKHEGKQAVCMGKFNGVYDYFICYIKIENISYEESKLIDVIEK